MAFDFSALTDNDDDEDTPGPSNPPRLSDHGHRSSRDYGGGGGDDDDDDGGGDYMQFYMLLGM